MKKFISLLVVTALLIGLLPSAGLFADNTSKVDLKQAIELAKEAFNFDATGYEFNSSYNEGTDGRRIWSLNWYSKTGTGGSFNASIDADTGEITNMNQWESSSTPYSRIPKYTREEAIAAATELAVKLQPLKFKETKLVSSTQNLANDMYSDTYNLTFKRQINGIDSQYNAISVNVDKNTLKIRYFDLNWDNGSFPDSSKAISIDAAKKIFEEKLGIELSYNLVYQSDSNSLKPILVYSLKNGNRPIDALTGELINNSYYGPMAYSSSMKMMDERAGANVITPEEQKVIDNNNKYITKDAAMKTIEKYVTIDKDYILNNSNLYGGNGSENAIWSFSWNLKSEASKYGYVYATVDAITGELRSFNISSSDLDTVKDTDSKISKETAKTAAENFIKQLQPNKFALTEYRDIYNEYDNMPTRPSIYNFNYIRKVNGIVCPSNGFNVSVNAVTGQITSYNLNWSTLEFPAATGLISSADAYNALYSKATFGLQYIKYYDRSKSYDNGETKLAYVLDNFSGSLDAKTGALLDYNGNPIVEKKPVAFTDIKGNKAEKDIQLLIEMGVIDSQDTEFLPDSDIMQKDFIKLLMIASQPYYYPSNDDSSNYDSFYDQAIQRKIISEKAKNPDAKVTKQDAAKMLVRALGFGFVADMSNIYNVTFSDAKYIPSDYKGYAVIASQLGLVQANNGYFSPSMPVSKGDTATMLVNFLKLDITLTE